MQSNFVSCIGCHNDRFRKVFFCISWIIGICIGSFFCFRNMEQNEVLMAGFPQVRFQVFPFCLAQIFSILILGALFLLNRETLFYSSLLLKGFAHGIFGCCIFCFYGTAGILIYVLLQLLDAVILTALFSFLFCSISGVVFDKIKGIVTVVVIAFILSVIEAVLISPFYFKLVNLL